MDQLGLLATPGIFQTLRNWLLLAVIRQDSLPNAGQVWSQPDGPYHGFGQGAMEASAEFIMMAVLYAGYTGEYKFTTQKVVSSRPASKSFLVLRGRNALLHHTRADDMRTGAERGVGVHRCRWYKVE